ncbi:MAG: Rab family GTPase [Candidatus Hodarchaeota archaeon]
MADELIVATVYSKFDLKLGGIPFIWIPKKKIQKDVLEKIAEDSLNLFIGIIKEDQPPKKLSIIHFSPFNLTGLVKMIRYPDYDLRGGISENTLTVVFDEKDDAIFYKYIDDFQFLFDEVEEEISKLENEKSGTKLIEEAILEFEKKTKKFLDDLRKNEMKSSSGEEFKEMDDAELEEEGMDVFKVKLIVCGDPGVGKTSLILRYTSDAFTRTYLPTLGMQISQKVVNYKKFRIVFTIWDLAGQSKFSPLLKQFYKGSKAQIIVFDLTRPETYKNAFKWHKSIQDNLKQAPIGIIIGNKSDLVESRKVSKKETGQIEKKLGLQLIETSALTGFKVEAAFTELAKVLVENLEKTN